MDHGFLYGDGIYETIRVYGGEPFMLKDHLKRLHQSAKGIGLRIPYSDKAIQKFSQRTISLNKQKESILRIMVTRGPGGFGFDPTHCKKPTFLMTSTPHVSPLKPYYARGIRLHVAQTRRNSPQSLLPRVKSCNCLNGILAKMEACRAKAQEALMLTLQGDVGEGTGSNIFLVKRGVVKTPQCKGQILPGVTRDLVCQLAKLTGLKVLETVLKKNDLLTADEVFMTNSIIEILPVQEITGLGKRSIKLGFPGPVAKNLMSKYRWAVASAR